jgi:hypothetical protein
VTRPVSPAPLGDMLRAAAVRAETAGDGRQPDLDELVVAALSVPTSRPTHAATALAALGVDSAEVRTKVAAELGSVRRATPLLRPPAVRRPLPALRPWLQITGAAAVSTLHVILLAIDVEESIAGAALRASGVSVDLLLRAAARVRDEVDPEDAGFVPPEQGMEPADLLPEPAEPRGRPKVTSSPFRATLGTAMVGGGQYLGSDLELERARPMAIASTARAIAAAVIAVMIVRGLLHGSSFWTLAALPALGLTLELVPVPLWLALQVVAMAVLPWPLRAAVMVVIVAGAVESWYDLQRLRADTGNPQLRLAQVRVRLRAGTLAALGIDPSSGVEGAGDER